MSTVTLEAIFGSLVNQLPEQEEAPFILNPAILPQPPDVITTDQLVIRIGRHGYHSYAYTCVDTLHFQGELRTLPQMNNPAQQRHKARGNIKGLTSFACFVFAFHTPFIQALFDTRDGTFKQQGMTKENCSTAATRARTDPKR